MPIDRSPSEIERDIDRERSELSATLSELGNRMTVDHLFREVGSQMRTHGGEFGRSAGTQRKNNPVALAITGVGLGWLIFGSNRPPQHHEDVQGIGRRDPYGYPPELTDVQSYRARSAHGAPAHGAPESASGSHGASWYDKARASVGSASSSVGERASQARNSASDGLGRAGQRAGESRDAAARRMNEMRERLREGTDHLSREGRDRVVAARERAMMARDQAGDNMRRGADAATDFYERQPLMAGMLALAAGALIAGVAARTRWEDERIGPYRDD